MKKKKKTIRKKSVNQLKKKAWKLFSIYIRLRDTNARGFGRCFTCTQILFWKNGQAGHFIPGRFNSILFDERGVHLQCYRCNINLGGNTLPYLDHMLADYGKEVVDELRAKNQMIHQFTVKELETLIEAIKEKTRLLNK